MQQKVLHFGDTDTAQAVMRTAHPGAQKEQGKKVSPYSHTAWHQVAPSVMRRGLFAKFSQNSPALRILLGTGTKVLIEASPKDDFWGVRLPLGHTWLYSPIHWNGENIMGSLLMELRGAVQVPDHKVVPHFTPGLGCTNNSLALILPPKKKNEH